MTVPGRDRVEGQGTARVCLGLRSVGPSETVLAWSKRALHDRPERERSMRSDRDQGICPLPLARQVGATGSGSLDRVCKRKGLGTASSAAGLSPIEVNPRQKLVARLEQIQMDQWLRQASSTQNFHVDHVTHSRHVNLQLLRII